VFDRQDIGDTRHSPAETLVRALESNEAQVVGYDPLLDYWPEMNRTLPNVMPDPTDFDAIILSTPHKEFTNLDVVRWLGTARPVLLDTSNVLTLEKRNSCRNIGVRVESVGRGDGL
jgi:UDP-N-acetyl-D-mannosaminuronate dehydrogenase